MEEYFNGPRSVAIEVALQVHNGAIALVPDGLLVAQLFGKSFAAENLRMHSNDEHFLVVGTIEDADLPAFGKPERRAPEKIMFQFFDARLFETGNLAALRIDSGHHVADGAVLARGVHSLENQQQRVAVGRVEKAWHGAQRLDVFFQKFLIPLLRFAKRLHRRRPLLEIDFFSWPHMEIF